MWWFLTTEVSEQFLSWTFSLLLIQVQLLSETEKAKKMELFVVDSQKSKPGLWMYPSERLPPSGHAL